MVARSLPLLNHRTPPATINTSASAPAKAGARNQDNHADRWGLACSSRTRAISRVSKYAEGSGACHSSSNAIVFCMSANLSAQASQPDKCSFIDGEASPAPAATSSIKSVISSHFMVPLPLHKFFQLFLQRFVGPEQ